MMATLAAVASADENGENGGEEAATTTAAATDAQTTAAAVTTGGDVKLDTGIEGIMLFGGIAVIAAGAVAIARKRK